ncbi:CHRD domain-containing protein [Halomicrococcus sp. NG-SE-24]|uniref:CHRD domain-containing protein n=1 Tax=Halomicrococcus sp. NG-SE-24 TaxID=3436928 RepID=UPI003D961F9E
MTNRRNFLRAGAAAAGGLATAASVQAQDGRAAYSAGRMSGGAVANQVRTEAEGAALFVRDGDGSDGRMQYVLIVTGIENVTQAHIHRGGEGDEGPVVTWLYPGPMAREPQRIPGRLDGVLVTGQFRSGDLVGPLEGAPLSELVAAIEDGNAFVQVHTEGNPAGEIRGQLAGVEQSTVQFRNRVEVTADDGFGLQRSVQLQVNEQS